jgi:hypothetical protein
MTAMDVTRQLEAEDLAHAKDMVQLILREWNLMTWNELLADDVVLSLRLGAVGINQAGGFDAVGGNLRVKGRADAKRVLQSIYSDLRSGLSVTTEIVSGYDVALLGNWAVRSTKENTEASSLPIVLYMAFDPEGKIEKMTIAAVDLHPLAEAIRAAAQSATGHAR